MGAACLSSVACRPRCAFSQKIGITATVPEKQPFTLQVKATDTVNKVKKKVLHRAGIAMSGEWDLTHNGELLDDSGTLDLCFVQRHYPYQTNAELVLTNGSFQIFISTFTGKAVAIDIDAMDTVNSLKQKIEDKVGVPVEDQRLTYRCKELSEGRNLADYNIQREGTLQLNSSLRGGEGPSFGFGFNRLEGVVKKQFNPKLPAYRCVSRGLSFSSECKNSECKAYRCRVMVSKAFGTFDLAYESSHLRCPVCKERSKESTLCGFYKAEWKFEGQLKGGEEEVEQSGRADTHEYYTFKEGDDVEWRYLRVTVTKLKKA